MRLCLSRRQVIDLSLKIGVKCYPTPKNIPTSWELTLCKQFLGQRYTNSGDRRDFVVVKQPESLGCLPYVIHHTKIGFADRSWFTMFIPELEKIIGEPQKFGRPFGKKFNQQVNALFYEDERKGMLPEVSPAPS